MIGFLDDLFVVPDFRSGGEVAVLIEVVQLEAKAQGCGVVRRIARDYNCRARRMYDQLAEKTERMLCEMTEVAAK